MKLILYSIIVGLLLSSVAYATSSCGVAAAGTELITSMYQAAVIGAENAIAGKELIINCTRYVNLNNSHGYVPTAGELVYIVGYDQNQQPNGFAVNATTGLNGLYPFTPPLAGEYYVQVGNMTPFQIDVKKNLVKSTSVVNNNQITGGVVAPEVVSPPVDGTPDAPPVVEAPADENQGSLLGLVVNGSKGVGAAKQVPNFVMMLVGLLIS